MTFCLHRKTAKKAFPREVQRGHGRGVAMALDQVIGEHVRAESEDGKTAGPREFEEEESEVTFGIWQRQRCVCLAKFSPPACGARHGGL